MFPKALSVLNNDVIAYKPVVPKDSVSIMTLLTSGDIELNPGPEQNLNS